MIVQTFDNPFLIKPLSLQKFIHSLALFATAIEEDKVKVAFLEVLIVLQYDLVNLLELMFVCVNQREKAAFAINYQCCNDKACLFFNVVPSEMGYFNSFNILPCLCSPFAISKSFAHDNQVLFSHHTKDRVTATVVSQLVVLKKLIGMTNLNSVIHLINFPHIWICFHSDNISFVSQSSRDRTRDNPVTRPNLLKEILDM